jgi:hypothetical protein
METGETEGWRGISSGEDNEIVVLTVAVPEGRGIRVEG